MKLTFFLIGFCLIFLQVYLRWQHKQHPGPPSGNITVSSENSKEVIRWSGNIRLNQDESAIDWMSPGSYFRFRFNEKKFSAESNLQGEIHYEMEDGSGLPLSSDSSVRFTRNVLSEAISLGFYGYHRAERLFEEGGVNALLEAIPQLKLDGAKTSYFDLLFRQDSLSTGQWQQILKQISRLGNDYLENQYLMKILDHRALDSQLVDPWLDAVAAVGNDYNKKGLLESFIRNQALSDSSFIRVLVMGTGLGSDFEKEELLSLLTVQEAGSPVRFGRLLKAVDEIGNDQGKQNLLHKLMNAPNIQTTGWMSLLAATGQLSADYEKSNLLIQISKQMPRNDSVVNAYREVARTIGNDSDYGKAMRALE